MSRSQYAVLAALLSVLTAIDALAVDISLPALPAIAAGLGTTEAAVQISLSAMIFGTATGQLVQGPASDRFGRRPVLLVGLSIFILGCLGAGLTSSIDWLIFFRFVQGLGASAGQILARAIVRDKYAREEAARLLSFGLIGLAFAPIVAPLLGAFATSAFGWRSIFYVMAGYGGIALLLFWLYMEETHTALNRRALNLGEMARNYTFVMKNGTFWAYALCNVAAFSGLFAFLTGSPAVFMSFLGHSREDFAIIFAATLLGHMFALLFNAGLVRRFGLDPMLRFGVSLAAISGTVLALVAWFGTPGVLATALPVFFFLAGFALIVPQAIAGAMTPFPQMAGAAASLLGFMQIGAGALTATLVALLSDGSQIAMTMAVFIAGLAALAVWALLVRPRQAAPNTG